MPPGLNTRSDPGLLWAIIRPAKQPRMIAVHSAARAPAPIAQGQKG
jgi:hypothetical protein